MNMSPTFIRQKKIKSRYRPNCTFCPFSRLFYSQLKKLSKHRQRKRQFFWKALDHSQNNCMGLKHWFFVHLMPKLTYTTSNFNNLRNCLESNKFIDGNRWNPPNQQPVQNLPQTFRGSKYVCTVWIRLTENFQSHPRTSFRINEHWSNKYDTQKSKIHKIRLERRTWWIF